VNDGKDLTNNLKPKHTYAGSRAAGVALRAGTNNAFPKSQYIVAQIEVNLLSDYHCLAEVFFCSENP
jgi:hypothetical protein